METLNDIVTLKNITGEDFVFMYDKREYFLPANGIKRFPRFLADHCLRHYIDFILNSQNKKTNNTDARRELAGKIVLEIETFAEPPRKSAADELDEKVTRLNKPSDLDSILKRNTQPVDQTPYEVKVDKKGQEVPGTRKVVEPPVTPKTPATVTTQPQDASTKGSEEFAGLKAAEDKLPPAGEAPVAPPMPTKAELLKYAEDTVGMTKTNDKGEIDPTWKKLEKMTVPQLIKELDYPMPEEE